MASYIVRTPLRHGRGKEPTPPGETVELDQAEGDALVALDALAPAPDDTAAAKPLARMNRAELTAAAEAAGVEIAPGMTNKQVAAAIEAKAAAGAAAGAAA